MNERSYIAIDLKSFYASVECRERGLDPLNTNLVVADESRTDKTICLAVTPSLKAHNISGRARLFEVKERVKEVNAGRRRNAPYKKLIGKSYIDSELKQNQSLELDFLIAPPRMALYMKYSSNIYNVYLKYVAPEDVIVYSIDEVFIDVTPYLKTYNTTPHELCMTMIHDVLKETGITATAGIGSNLFLAKIAMDIVAKHTEADKDGVRIAELNEMTYREQMWSHEPITDFWRVGHGYARRFEALNLHTMGDIALCSVENEEVLYKTFGKNAELLIDHAWGWEPTTIKDVKAYKPSTNSLSSGQVLKEPYNFDRALIVMKEMADDLSLQLTNKHLVTQQITITVGYDVKNVNESYRGDIKIDGYGRQIPKHAHGTFNLEEFTSASKDIKDAAEELFFEYVDPTMYIRRLNICAYNVVDRSLSKEIEEKTKEPTLFDFLFEDEKQEEKKEKETKGQEAILSIKERFGKNSILKGMNLLDGATAKERNEQIGGHKA